MKEAQAIPVAEAARPKGPVPAQATLSWLKQRFIEISDAGLPAPKMPLKDLLVWIAHFHLGNAWVELAISDATGEVVRVEKSRVRFPEESPTAGVES